MRAARCFQVIVHSVVDDALSPDFPLGDAVEMFLRRERRALRVAF